MILEHHLRIPDRVFFGLTAGTIILAVGFVAWAWPDLPNQLPIHYGVTGQPDKYAESKATALLWPVIVQLLLVFLVSWAYRHPHQFNFPTRHRLDTFPPVIREQLVTLSRHLLAVTILLATLIIANIAQATILIGLGLVEYFQPNLILFIIVFLLMVIGLYTWWMRKIIRRAEPRISPS